MPYVYKDGRDVKVEAEIIFEDEGQDVYGFKLEKLKELLNSNPIEDLHLLYDDQGLGLYKVINNV